MTGQKKPFDISTKQNHNNFID